MDREQAKQYIISRSREYLTPDNTKKGFVCPLCGSGTGKNGTGITTKDGKHFTCWAGCFTNADIIDIIGLQNGLTDYNSKLQTAAKEFGITVDPYQRPTAAEAFNPVYQNQPKSEQNTQQNIHNNTYTSTQTEQEPDYTDFFLQAAQDIDKTDYHRALSRSTLERFKVGYVESWRHPKAPKMEASQRLIIPTSKHSYLARYAGAGDFINYLGKVENKSKVGRVRIFNRRAIREAASPVFIVEGEIDAMSFYEAGAEAVGLGSLSNTRLLLADLEKQKPAVPLIIALDNEREPEKQAKVEKAIAELEEGLERLEIPHYRIDVAKPYKDANEALMSDKDAFRAAVAQAIAQVEEEEAAALEAEREALRREAVAYTLPSFLKSIEESKRAAFIPTGFAPLDNLLDGGLYAGLYVVGAISSLGKTTFCLNIAEQIARAGHDVLIFSLEMARNELIAKSISRLTLIKDIEENQSTANAKTTRGILTGTRYANYSQAERDLIQRSIEEYAEFAQNIYIVEGIGNVGVTEIREEAQKHIRITGKAPAIIIDYLQLLAPSDMRATDKQNTDKNVLELKRLSRDYSLPIIGISSFNRDNYTQPVNMAAYKESGAIEYCADCLIGLQYDGMDYQEGEADKAREKRIRELFKQAIEDAKACKPQRIQVKVLKHRNGSKGDTYLDFYPMFNHFTDKVVTTENTGGWSKAEGGYTRPKKSKREAERERLARAFFDVQHDDFTADLTDIADALDKSKKQVRNLIAEYGGFTIIGETVRLSNQEEPPTFTELGASEEDPF